MNSIICANASMKYSASELRRIRDSLEDYQPQRVIAADGGYRLAKALGLDVDLVVGDFDSLGLEMRERLPSLGVSAKDSPEEKDETDLELALREIGSESNHVTLLGALDSRVDFAFDAFRSLLKLKLWKSADFLEPDFRLRVMKEEYRKFEGVVGQKLSVYPLFCDSVELLSTGLKWPLQGVIEGSQSNQTSAKAWTLDIRSGQALLLVEGPAPKGWK